MVAVAPLVSTGGMDVFRHVKFGTTVVPRPFPSLAAAKEYLISALGEAEKLADETKRDSEAADDRICHISDVLTLSFGQLRHLAEEANNQEAYAPLDGLADQVAGFSKIAAVKKKLPCLQFWLAMAAVAVMIAFLFAYFVGLPIAYEKYYKIAQKVSPFMFTIVWGLSLKLIDDRVKIIVKKYNRLLELERVGLFIAGATKRVCRFLAPPPPGEV